MRKIIFKKCQEPKVHGGVHEKQGGIGDAASQTVGANNTSGMQCPTVTLRPIFWGVEVSQFWVDGQSVNFWVLVSRGQKVFGL